MTESPLDRREFHAKLTKGAALFCLAAAATEPVCAQEAQSADQPTAPENDEAAEAEKPHSPAVLIVELTKQTFPHDRMSDDFLIALQSYVELNLSYSQTLDSFGLTNADPPGPMMFFG
ncbi:MAG: hypothetical protein WD065_14375 [Planctomycetaceae bacterium]